MLANVVNYLKAQGAGIKFVGGPLVKFKSAPGLIKAGDPHFRVYLSTSKAAELWIYVDVEFKTLGARMSGAADLSDRHEADIVVVHRDFTHLPPAIPDHDDISLAVECKDVANFSKSILKQVLGVRRELSYVPRAERSSFLCQLGIGHSKVRANPPSEFCLAFTDPGGNKYTQSPRAFGIDFKWLLP